MAAIGNSSAFTGLEDPLTKQLKEMQKERERQAVRSSSSGFVTKSTTLVTKEAEKVKTGMTSVTADLANVKEEFSSSLKGSWGEKVNTQVDKSTQEFKQLGESL